MPDIDIDCQTNINPHKLFGNIIAASMIKNNQLVQHPCGYYFQNIPTDKVTGLAAIPYKHAEDLGYFKIDFLHLSILDHIVSKNEIRRLANTEPDWTLLTDEKCVQKLFHLNKHFYLLKRVRPKSINELADCLALIRPSKTHLIQRYIEEKDRDKIRKELYTKPEDGQIWFKKSHSVAYALTIVVQLHLIKQKRM